MKPKEKLVAFVIEPIDGKWEMVCQTEYYDSGKWVTGMVLMTSLEDVIEKANKQKLNIIPIGCMNKKKFKV